MKEIAAVIAPSKKNEINLKINPIASFWVKDKPSNRFVIQIGRTLSKKREARPKVKTTIRDDFLFTFNSSRLVIPTDLPHTYHYAHGL